ncbi:spermidine synthase [Halovenus rubra]|uniref:Spermidine synthase n=2 Tax=Halovenus rubra TaxID=869890 RepID=A0ABD5X945_9EURY|nr:spermidine synthase [Halovenus rubra]
MQIKPLITPSKQSVLHVTALVVALCSFAYELVYSELLTIIYGGTVTQYGLTIGLFFSSLGIGSYLCQHLDDNRPSNFFRVQLYLAFIAPAGFLFILWLNTASPLANVPSVIPQAIARTPVIAVGVLSGFELPLLLSMVNNTEQDTIAHSGVERAHNAVSSGCRRVTSVLFHTASGDSDYTQYSTVLAMDYLGGLAGALIYVFYLYPELGLIPSVFVLALLNCVAALMFTLRFSARPWGIFNSQESPGVESAVGTREHAAVFISLLLLTSVLGGAVVSHDTVDQELSEYYIEDIIEDEYPSDTVEASVSTLSTTQHQQIVQYERRWVGDSDNKLFPGSSEECLRLDTAIQLCDSWANSYHNGLVDVPMTMFENSTATDVLLLGGGDWIAADHLREHGVSVDQVDLDGEFMEQSKTNEYLSQYHNDAYQYEHLDSHQQDAYTYLANTDETYDLILLDLPGATSDDTLRLYTTEFYALLNEHLSTDGVLGTWTYSQYSYGDHHKAYLNTVSDAGFTSQLPYWAYDDLNNNGETQLGERFYLFSTEKRAKSLTPHTGSNYVQRYSERYSEASWQDIPTYDGVEVNSIFDPNYDVIIDSYPDP